MAIRYTVIGLTSENSQVQVNESPSQYRTQTLKITNSGVETWGYNSKMGVTALMFTNSYTREGTFLGLSTTSGGSVVYDIGDEISLDTSGDHYFYVVAFIPSNDPYLTTGFDLTSIADAIRSKTWRTSDLTFPSQYISSISNLPTGNIQSSRSVTYNSPGSATVLPDSGYVGFESASIEFSPSVWDGQYTWTPAPVPITFTATCPSGHTIDMITYNLNGEDGMTWGDWIESEYNTDGFMTLLFSGNYIVQYPNNAWDVKYNGTSGNVYTTTSIEANHTYGYGLH